MDSANRERYLKLMGIDTYALRPDSALASQTMITDTLVTESAPVAEDNTAELATEAAYQSPPSTSEALPEAYKYADTPSLSASPEIIEGIEFLAGTGSNGLVVILSRQDKDMNPEQRQLLSNMLKAIDFKPADTAYGLASEQAITNPINLRTVKAVLVFGKTAGDHMVMAAGARRVPGEDYFLLNNLPVVVTLRPEEVLQTPALKARAWADLKILQRLVNGA